MIKNGVDDRHGRINEPLNAQCQLSDAHHLRLRGCLQGANVVEDIRVDLHERTWHLIVHLAQRRAHLIGQRARHDHDVALPRAGPEDDAEAVEVIARCSRVHHLYRTTRQACSRELRCSRRVHQAGPAE